MDEGTGTRRFAFAGDERSLNKDHDYPGGVDRIKSNIIMSDDFCEPFSPPVFFFSFFSDPEKSLAKRVNRHPFDGSSKSTQFFREIIFFQILKNRSPKE